MKKKGMILCVAIVAVLLIGGGACVHANSQKTPTFMVKTSSLSLATLQNTISTTGVIENYAADIVSWIICPSKITATMNCLNLLHQPDFFLQSDKATSHRMPE
jgi:hypothetical protein